MKNYYNSSTETKHIGKVKVSQTGRTVIWIMM